jgi:hypothetical protein
MQMKNIPFLLAALTFFLIGCADDADLGCADDADLHAEQDLVLRMNEIQVLGTHNSYFNPETRFSRLWRTSTLRRRQTAWNTQRCH